jgi:hypothetical protein
MFVVLSLVATSNAELIDRGGGLVYDSDQNVTWLQDADLYEMVNWNTANTRINDLVYYDVARNVYWDDWRLPTVPYHDTSCSEQYAENPTKSYGYNCTGNEFGHLFHTELGNLSYYDSDRNFQPEYGLKNSGPFTNMRNSDYWLQKEELAYSAYFYSNYSGELSATSIWSAKYVLPVRNGDVGLAPVVPEPISSILFATGGALLAGRRYL